MILGLPPAGAVAFDPARNTYLMRCGGCHGIEGVSVPKAVPTLRGQVGTFLCTQEGRDYMLRVPNVAMSRITDDRLMADVMNFVAFDLAGASTPPGAARFTAADAHAARGQAIQTSDIDATRAGVWDRARLACNGQPGGGRQVAPAPQSAASAIARRAIVLPTKSSMA